MKIQLIRNATLVVQYAGRRFLVDPYLAAPLSLPSFTGRSANPMTPLPIAAATVVAGAEMSLVSHLHTDHFDAAAQALLPQELPLFCQPGDEGRIHDKGFTNVTPLADSAEWQGITLTRTPGRHGSSAPILKMMGSVAGFVWQAAGEPTVYWAGDTVWYDEVAATIARYRPDVIITHSGGAIWGDDQELIIMDAGQTMELCRAAPAASVIAVHMEALDHCLTTRADLHAAGVAAGLPAGQLTIPADGAEWQHG